MRGAVRAMENDMDMSNPVTQQYLISLVAIVVGLSGWFLPYKWNVLRLRARYASLVSERVNLAVPKVVGTVLALSGVLIAYMTATGGVIVR
ncbi:MAG TPA: hypothetical protein VK886_03655 [Vicinamibacterales bacterium]|nr:hypothetical protein [Vicinamibacterales bacterium]